MEDNTAITIYGARERNLKNISVRIPKKKITVFTGVSGSGKSSLVFDTIAAESQRQLNENYSNFVKHRLPHYGQPDVDTIENLPVTFVVNQKRLGGNIRSTVGTATDIYSLLRLLFSRIGKPFVGYAEVFSFNNAQGMCERCGGTGKVETIDIIKLLDKEKSLQEGAIRFPTFEPGGWRIKRYIHSGLFDNHKKLRDFTPEEMKLLLYKKDFKLTNPPPEWPKTSLYEGVVPRIERSFLNGESSERNRNKKEIEHIVSQQTCPDCNGTRLNPTVLSCHIEEKSIGDCTSMQIDSLLHFIKTLEYPIATRVIQALIAQLEQMVAVDLGYLHLNRETSSLSGGESQRIKMLRQLGSSLTDVAYVIDEPSIGLHPYNVDKVNSLLKTLRGKGNTLLIVEHDPDIIQLADYIIDMGPGAGSNGGEVVFQGTFEALKRANTLTAMHLAKNVAIKEKQRKPQGFLPIVEATLHNLKSISVKIPMNIVTVVTGVAGSGKSSLMTRVFPENYPEAIIIDQKPLHTSRRSNIVTYTGVFDAIRNIFARENRVSSSLFSFNAKGACQTCKGLGVIHTDLAFLDSMVTVCETCKGKRYTDTVLLYKIQGKNIADVLNLTVKEACILFETSLEIHVALSRLNAVGLGYVTLGQSLDTLSGGELQRLKLAAELTNKGNIYVLDEPTSGLHMADISNLMCIIDVLVDKGNTVIIIEHNLEIISQADWIIDFGPGAGDNGGYIVFEGLPQELANSSTITGSYLRNYLEK